MRRHLGVVGFILLVGPHMVSAQSNSALPTRDEFKLLLVKAYDQPNLWSYGSPAFHLRAKTKAYGVKAAVIEGTYELWWDSKDRWREDVSWNNQMSSQFAVREQIWRTGEDTHRADTFRVTSVLKTWQGVYMDIPSANIQARTIGSTGFLSACASGHKSNMPPQTICLDPATGSLSETHLADQHWEYADYIQLEAKRFPRRIEYWDGKKPLVEVDTELLEKFDAAKSADLVPPTGTPPAVWCSDMIAPRATHYGAPTMDFRQKQTEEGLLKNGFGPPVPARYADLGMVIFSVDEKGRVIDVQAFLPGGPHAIDKGEKKMMMSSAFQPASCHGKPVSGELILW